MERHNQHHSHPNQHGVDPDVFIPIIAFAPEDLQGKGKLLLRLMKYQAYFFFPMLSLALIDMQIHSIEHLLQKKIKYPLAERLLIFLHVVLYVGLLLLPHLASHRLHARPSNSFRGLYGINLCPKS